MTDHRTHLRARTHATQAVRGVPAPVVLARKERRYPAEAPVRQFVDSPLWHSHTRKQSPFTRLVAGMLIPLLLVSPHARVYADEVEVSETPSATEGAVEVLPTEVPPENPVAQSETTSQETQTPESPETPETSASNADGTSVESPDEGATPESEEIVPAPDGTPPVEQDPPEQVDATDVPSPGDVPAENTGTTEGDATTTPEDVPANDELPPSDEADSTEGETGTSTEQTQSDETDTESGVLPEEAVGTSTDASTEEVIAEAEQSTTTPQDIDVATSSEEFVEEAQATPQIDERVIEERLRDKLRKEVEEEFMRGCITFESSGYYCLKTEELGAESGVSTPASAVLESVQDGGGDKEIIVVREGARIVLTANEFDDAFPSMDITGTRIVWQGMKNGRWQIFTTDLSATGTPVVTQVTDGRESNFNPKIDGDNIVWQGWVNENWEIFMATRRDAKSPLASEHLPPANALMGVGPDWSVERLTENTHPDMFPSLHGNIVTWQSREGDNWIVYAYSISAKTKTRLSSDGVKSENPRFSITWEESDGEGTSRLVGYDISTGEKVDLTERARATPSRDFPRPSPTPVSSPDQATIPPAPSGTSTPQRADDEPEGDDTPLP